MTEHLHRQHVRLRDGRVRPLLPGEILPDGATLFTPLALRDAEHHSLRDAAEKAYMDYVAELSDAWQSEPVKVAANADAAYAMYCADLDWRTRRDNKYMGPRAATPESAYKAMCADLQNAWQRR